MSYSNVLVTGANRGLGLEFVRQFLELRRKPKNIIATTRKESSVLNELKAAHPNLHILIYEALDYEALDGFVEKVQQIVGNDGLDLLINNAGIFLQDLLESLDPTVLMKNIENNAVAPMMLTKKLVPVLKESAKKRRTVVVQVSSTLGSIGMNTSGGWYAYRASKSALNSLSKSFAIDIQQDEIIVIILNPGWVQTDLGTILAPTTAATSVSGMMNVIENASLQRTGEFIDFNSKDMAW